MKAFFLTLLLANLGFWGWRVWIVQTNAPPAFVEAQNLPLLVLVGEDPEAIAAIQSSGGAATGDTPPQGAIPAPADNTSRSQSPQTGVAPTTEPEPASDDELPSATAGIPQPVEDNSAPAPPTSQDVAVAATSRCVSLGPFLSLRDATQATASLNEMGLLPNQRLSESQVWFGHWVHLPPAASRDAAIAVVEQLRGKGITDIYIEPSGPMRHSISLGVFSDAAHAETRAGQIRRLGVDVRPQISDRYRDSSVYWVDFAMPAGRVINPDEFKASSSKSLRLEGRECPQPPAG